MFAGSGLAWASARCELDEVSSLREFDLRFISAGFGFSLSTDSICCPLSPVVDPGATPSCVLHLKFLMSWSYLWIVLMFIDFAWRILTSPLCFPFVLIELSGSSFVELRDPELSEAALENVVSKVFWCWSPHELWLISWYGLWGDIAARFWAAMPWWVRPGSWRRFRVNIFFFGALRACSRALLWLSASWLVGWVSWAVAIWVLWSTIPTDFCCYETERCVNVGEVVVSVVICAFWVLLPAGIPSSPVSSFSLMASMSWLFLAVFFREFAAYTCIWFSM